MPLFQNSADYQKDKYAQPGKKVFFLTKAIINDIIDNVDKWCFSIRTLSRDSEVRRRLMENSLRNKSIIRVFLVIEGILLVLIKVCELLALGRLTNVIMYLAVLGNGAVTFFFWYLYGRNSQSKRANKIALGMAVTMVADLFLTLIDTNWSLLPGFILFCIVQVIYAMYLGMGKRGAIVRIVLCIAVPIALYFAGVTDPVTVIGVIDLVLLLCNAVMAWFSARDKVSLLFKIGITLFLGCDVSIALRTLTTGAIHDVAKFMVWIFYVPALVFITLSYAIVQSPRN